jgi:hypothetical protein
MPKPEPGLAESVRAQLEGRDAVLTVIAIKPVQITPNQEPHRHGPD